VTSTADPQALLLQLLDPSNRADPYPAYDALRAHGPFQLPGATLTVFSTFRDCDEVLRHPSAANDRSKSTLVQRQLANEPAPQETFTPSFLFLDPPDHTRLRRLVSKAFAPKVVKALEPDIAAMVDALLDAATAGDFDVVTGLAYPLPVAVICRLLGVPIADEPHFSRASAILAKALDPIYTVTGEAHGNVDEIVDAGQWLRQYLRDLIARRRADPGDDLMSALIHVEESGDQLTEDEIVATCNLLLIAGH
jgi:cytochrome P450